MPHFIHDGVYQSFDGKPPLVFQLGGLSVAKKWTLPCSAEFYLGGRLHAKAQPGDILINKIER